MRHGEREFRASSLPSAPACACGNNTGKLAKASLLGEKQSDGVFSKVGHTAMSISLTRLGDRAPISLYPGGAFQFGGKRHPGAILVSPSGIYDWSSAGTGFDEAGLFGFIGKEEARRCDLLLLGTGPGSLLLPASFAGEVERRGLGLEAMDTAAACRTYNILFAENRHFLAALLPI